LFHIPKVLVVDFLPDIIYRNTVPRFPPSHYKISRMVRSKLFASRHTKYPVIQFYERCAVKLTSKKEDEDTKNNMK
jgi:hypothetical protein